MEAVNMKCPNCMGRVVPYGNGVYGRCENCESTFKLKDEDPDKVDEVEEDELEDEDDEDEDFDFEAFFDEEYEDRVDNPSVLSDAFFGPRLRENPKKIDQAIAGLDIDDEDDCDEVYFVLDTTIFGSGKRGLACTVGGVYLVDEDGDDAFLDWDDFDDMEISRDGGTMYVGGYKFIMSDAEARIVTRVLQDLQD